MHPNTPPSEQDQTNLRKEVAELSRRKLVGAGLMGLGVWVTQIMGGNGPNVPALGSKYEQEGYTIYSDHIYAKKEHDNTITVIIKNPSHIYGKITGVQNLIIEGTTIVLTGGEKTKILARFDISLLGVNKGKFIEDISK